MATVHYFSNKKIILPGVYSTITSGIKNPSLSLAFGNTLVIDTGSGADFGGGAGINGTLKQGKEALYTFDNVRDFRKFVGGGLWWLLGGPLFFPGGGANAGISSLTYVRALTTVPAEIEIPFGAQEDSDSDGDSSNDGSITVQCRNEGTVGNGAMYNDILSLGFGAKVIAGKLDTSKFIVQFWRGTYKGLDTAISNGTPYDGLNQAQAQPELICESPEVSTVQELVDWANDTAGAGYQFNLSFKLKESTIGSVSDVIVAEDITNGYELASGGTEVFSADRLAEVLENISGSIYDFILADNWGDEVRSASNLTIEAWIATEAKIKPDLYVAAGESVGEFNSGAGSSIATAIAYNSQYTTVVHGGAKKIDVGGRSLKEYDSIYKAAVALGREAGLAPQIPLTFKGLGIDGEVHELNDREATTALEAGVLVSRLDNGSFEIVKGVNSLQNNDYLVNPDGSTHSKQLRRIIRQINKELVVNAKAQLLKNPNGTNRNTLSEEDVKSWTETFLQARCATDQADNLLISFANVEVTSNQDAYEILYQIEANTEVSSLFFTGVLIDTTS